MIYTSPIHLRIYLKKFNKVSMNKKKVFKTITIFIVWKYKFLYFELKILCFESRKLNTFRLYIS